MYFLLQVLPTAFNKKKYITLYVDFKYSTNLLDLYNVLTKLLNNKIPILFFDSFVLIL